MYFCLFKTCTKEIIASRVFVFFRLFWVFFCSIVVKILMFSRVLHSYSCYKLNTSICIVQIRIKNSLKQYYISFYFVYWEIG